MKKNQVKTSQSKPKKGTPDIPEFLNSPLILNEDLSISSSAMNIDVPVEPSFNYPVKSTEILQKSNESSGNLSKAAFEFSKSLNAEAPQATSEYSEMDTNPQELVRQIQELQQEITSMTQRIVSTEEAMRHKDNEAQELKELLVRLRENQVMIMETSDKQPFCKSCGIF